jgi:hypothetical protein
VATYIQLIFLTSQPFPVGGVDRQFFMSILEADDTGRFIKYNPTTKEVTVLVDHLRFPNGVATSKDGTYVILAETRNGRCVNPYSSSMSIVLSGHITPSDCINY